MRFTKRSTVALIVLVGLVLRVVWLVVAHPAPLSDYWEYRRLGTALLDFGQFGYPEPEAVRLPGYPAFLALLMVASKGLFWLSLCNVLLSTALIVLLYELALELSRGDLLYAQLSALVCALYPTFIFYSPVLASEHLFALMYFGGLLLLVSASRAGVLSLPTTIVAGLLLGASILTRGEGLFYLPVYLLAIFFSLGSLRARALRGVVIVLCALLVITPWYVRNVRLFGQGIGLAGSSGFAFYFSHNRYSYSYSDSHNNPELMSPTFEQSARLGWAAGLENLRQDPAHVLKRMPIALANQYGPGETPYATLWGAGKAHSFGPSGWVTERQAIPGLQQLDEVTRAGYWLILILTGGSLLFWRTLPATSWALMGAVIGANWFCYCVVFFAMDRYRFTAEVTACMLTAATVTGLARQLSHALPPTVAQRGRR